MEAFLAIVAVLVIVVGIVGCIVPVIPGLPLAFIAILLYGFYDGFEQISTHYLVILGVLTVISMLMDYVLVIWGGKLFGSSNKGALGAVLGSILGIFIFPPLGIIVLGFLGAMAVEYYQSRNPFQAGKAACGAVLGFFSGMLFKFALGLAMLISFIIKIV